METGFQKLKRLLEMECQGQSPRLVHISKRLAEELASMTSQDWFDSSCLMEKEECEEAKKSFEQHGYRAAHGKKLNLPGAGARFSVTIEVDENLIDRDLTVIDTYR